MADRTPVVLIVDDEPDVADAYAELLSEDYDCRVAYGGREALEEYQPEIDVVLLDRRMPDISGDDVLDEIRDRDGQCRVAMVTAVDPDFDVIEMGFDDYLVKPVSEEVLDKTIKKMMKRSTYAEEVQTYFSLVTKKAALETEKPKEELDRSPRYQELLDEISDLRSELDKVVDELTLEDYAIAFKDIQTEQSI